MTCQPNGCPHFLCFFFIPLFLKLIVACRLYVIYVRENNYSNVYVMITWLVWITWTSLSTIQERPLNLITDPLIRLTPSLQLVIDMVPYSKGPRSTSIWHRSDAKVSDRCLIYVDPMVFSSCKAGCLFCLTWVKVSDQCCDRWKKTLQQQSEICGSCLMQLLSCQVTLDISRSPFDFQWGSRKYPG